VLHPATFIQIWLPAVDTPRNFFLIPTTEMLRVFQTVRDVVF